MLENYSNEESTEQVLRRPPVRCLFDDDVVELGECISLVWRKEIGSLGRRKSRKLGKVRKSKGSRGEGESSQPAPLSESKRPEVSGYQEITSRSGYLVGSVSCNQKPEHGKIGIYWDPGSCIIHRVYKGSPADKAGLRAGDEVLNVDERTARRGMIEGPADEYVRLEIARELPDRTYVFTAIIKRESDEFIERCRRGKAD